MAPWLLIVGGIALIAIGIIVATSVLQRQPIIAAPVGIGASGLVLSGGRVFVLGVLLLVARDDWNSVKFGSVHVERRGPPDATSGDFQHAA